MRNILLRRRPAFHVADKLSTDEYIRVTPDSVGPSQPLHETFSHHDGVHGPILSLQCTRTAASAPDLPSGPRQHLSKTRASMAENHLDQRELDLKTVHDLAGYEGKIEDLEWEQQGAKSYNATLGPELFNNLTKALNADAVAVFKIVDGRGVVRSTGRDCLILVSGALSVEDKESKKSLGKQTRTYVTKDVQVQGSGIFLCLSPSS